ncbi:MAG: fibronectin type III-like domain-contianing protein, partial [Muricauda sp.]|nr:fibronectin type III-like domain-contianing protein [Allomuricauda sp.]
FTISPGDYASFDSGRSSWVVEPGSYQVEIGASSEDIRQTLQFEVSKELVIEKLSPLLRPKGEINELHPD